MPGKNVPSLVKYMDVEMLVMSGGQESTEEEYRVLLASAGFSLEQLIPTPSGFYILESSAV